MQFYTNTTIMVISGQQRNNGTGAIQHVKFRHVCKLDFLSSKPHWQFHAHPFLLYQHVQTLLTFTISIIPRHSDFADFHNVYYIKIFRLCWLSQFLFYQDIQTLLTFTICIISGHSDFANFHILKRVWLQIFRLKSPLLATSNNNSSNTHDSGWKKMHAYKFHFSKKQTQTNTLSPNYALSDDTNSALKSWTLAMPLQLPSVFNVIMQAKGKCFFFFNPQDPTYVQKERDVTHPWCRWSWKVGHRQRVVAVQHGLKRWHSMR